MKTQRVSIISLLLALVMALSLCVSPIAGAQPAVTVAETRTEPADLLLAPTSPDFNPPLQDIIGVYAGYYQACAVTSSGGVKCWGAGPLANGSPGGSPYPVDVTADLGSSVTMLVGGTSHMCALTSSGGVKCWGSNWGGQLGDGTMTDSGTPVDVVGLTGGVTFLAAGDNHTCAVTSSGGVKCWGGNGSGQLGDGTTTDSGAPVDVVGLSSGVTTLGASMIHTCAVTGGGVKCWGANGDGQLGDGTTTDQLTPVDVVGLSDAVAVATGLLHSCALTSGGGVKCWSGSYGKEPVDVPGLSSGITALAVGNGFVCVLTSSGAVKCWGGNLVGQLGNGTTTSSDTPVDVLGLNGGVSMVTAGLEFACAATGGGVKCWGWNLAGQLGTGIVLNRFLPRDVVGLTHGVTAVTTGGWHTCALTDAGGVKCWGDDGGGQLGDGATTSRSTPVDVCAGGAAGCTALLSGVRAVTAGGGFTCALTNAGGVKCWGINAFGQLGDGAATNTSTPVDVCAGGLAGCTTPLSGIASVSAGSWHTCVLTNAGGVKCWGMNDFGQLGDGTTTQSSTPVDVAGLGSGVTAITAGGYGGVFDAHTCALLSSGGVRCWGTNTDGQLGDGTTTDSNVPVDVVGLSSGVTAISAGDTRTCAITSDGGVKCWGAGRMGNGAATGSSTPVDVCAGGPAGCTSMLRDIIKVEAGPRRTCGLTSSGAVKCWGGGIGTTPTNIMGLASGVTALDVANHICVLVGNGRPKCWGADGDGQLGLGTAVIQSTPVNVVAGPPAPSLLLNYPAGKPGSFFTLTGFDFPANSPLTLTVNGTDVTTTAATDVRGGFILFLDTAAADAGFYTATASVNPSATATASFILAASAPLQVQEGGGTTFSVPAGIAASPPLPPLQNVAALTAGGAHNCVLTLAGGVKCWGFNDTGQLGDGTTMMRSAPVGVVGLSSGVAAITAGGRHTCAITTGGGLKCWGSNEYGRLGDGANSPGSATPVDVVGLGSGVAVVAGGGAETCAVTTVGAVKCWGDNFAGQLGNDTTTNSNVPVDVVGLGSGGKSVVVGGANACALTTSGGVKCWGIGGFGALGNGATTNSSTPVDVVGLGSGVTALAAGFNHVCALTDAGGVKCWGWNGFGSVGDGTTTNRATPVDVVGLTSGVKAISAGMAGFYTGQTCALLETGAVKCWGQNSLGELGDGTTVMRTTPVDVVGLGNDIKAISLGKYHSCALTEGGRVKCWGDNTVGQLGMGRELLRPIAADVVSLQEGMTGLTAGGLHTCGLTASGAAKCWGSNWSGEVGDGGNSHRSTPTDVNGLISEVTKLAAGGQLGLDPTLKEHSCAIVNGGLKCWGDNSSGQLGDGTTTDRRTPVDVIGLSSGVTTVATGEAHTCAVTSSGAVKCWGDNSAAQLGDGTTTRQLAPVDVVGLGSGVIAVGAGAGHSCALTSGGGIKCWGRNTSGQLGDGTATDRPTPVDVVGLGSGVTALAVGSAHTCVLTSGGGVKCWGVNANGRLGDGATANRTAPVDVIGLGSGVTAIATGGMHTCALVNGGAKCWGFNGYGQLGTGTYTDAFMPTPVSGLTGAVTGLAAGQVHTCALVGNGRPKCWGSDDWGQLGQGILTGSLAPVDVAAALPPPSVLVNYASGRQGSFFTITGLNFAPSAPLTLTVNGVVLSDRQVTNATGGYVAFLDTTVADDGVYTVMLTTDASSTANFTLANSAPLRVQEGRGLTHAVPSGLTGVVRKYYMPLVLR